MFYIKVKLILFKPGIVFALYFNKETYEIYRYKNNGGMDNEGQKKEKQKTRGAGEDNMGL
ncbi:hypothetical protein PTH_2014 [Pelotomaculum thermopropionicum SI]|uniref:Uncharacterized protein n=1 Tax=Pelotomaculum thermopropionicum (strain DSM 13744 / JCM 10971 / SI) TaxID=370438 RepID=A5D0M5_PELTS|nr:hypothetical protein PTH_2014 [Pelotomaculum thermopropionicum SI]